MSLDTRRRDGLAALDFHSVHFDVPMSEHSAFGVGGPADALVEIGSLEEFSRIRRWCRRERLPLVPLPSAGGVLVRDGGLRGVVVIPAEDAPEPARSAIAELDGGSGPEGAFAELRHLRAFRDPGLGTPASQLLADAGATGVRLRGVRVSTDDGNLLVNEGAATARDVLVLVDWMRRRIEQRTGIRLEDAFLILGRDQAGHKAESRRM